MQNDEILFDESFGRPLRIDEGVPAFELEAFHAEKIKRLKLTDYKGTWIVLVFYPGDFTFICPTELEELANHYAEFQKENAEVLCVSTDGVYVHKAWHDTSASVKKITFPMIADRTGKLSRIFGVYLEETGEALRGSFIIDPEGRLKTIEIHHNDIGRSSRELMRKLKAARFVAEHGGKVCPASWEPGEDTLEPGLDLVGKL